MKPLITALVDTYNHERYIEQAIVSVLEQDFPAAEMEIVVVDDGSTDRTPEIVGKFAPQVRLLRKKNGGQASAFNAGIPESHGQFVALLDGDDWWAKGKLTAVLDTLERNPEDAAVGHGYYEVQEATKEVRVCAPEETKFFNLATPEAAREALHSWRFLLPSALTMRRKVLEQVMPIPEVLVFSADGPFQVASMAAGVRVLQEPLFYYRLHADNLYSVDPTNMTKMRRRSDLYGVVIDVLEAQLLRSGVPSESVEALLYSLGTDVNRYSLRTFGGSRLKAFRTEMRSFHSEFKNPSLGYVLFKYFVVGAATLLLPPRRFYQARDWYAQRNLKRFREQLCKTDVNTSKASMP
jgi:glycosyltransferase involved in cell wall biosynthesis